MSFPHSSRWSGLKEYISQPREIRHSLSSTSRSASAAGEGSQSPGRHSIHNWSRWAGQKIRRNTADVATVDEVHLFPGWATERPRKLPGGHENAFDVVFHVSGFARSRKTPEFLSRSQRAFLKIARSFASIPKHQPILHTPDSQELQDFEASLHLPPRPSDISDGYDIESLDAYFRDSGNQSQEIDDTHFAPDHNGISAEVARMYENIESRLKLFWASSLPSRRVQLSVFLRSPDDGPDPQPHRQSLESQPLLTKEMLTRSDGHFSGTFTLDWDDICTHPVGTHIALSQIHAEHELLVETRVINTDRNAHLHETPATTMHIPISYSTLRVISDIDDTIKISRVVDGARAAFNQVFVKDLEDTVIPEMGQWYDTMWKRGVRFHYVSNSPFELLPVINDFIGISKLPFGSIRLRSYTGRSLFNGLLSAPAARKRANVVEFLDHFPDSKFILIGDSGEQDLELYSELAGERPRQIAGVFIRDVSAVGLEDPTGPKVGLRLIDSPIQHRSRGGTIPLPGSHASSYVLPKRAASDTNISSMHPSMVQVLRQGTEDIRSPTSFSMEPLPDPKILPCMSEESSSSSSSSSSSWSPNLRSSRRPVTEAGKKRWELQKRVDKARLLMPSHVVLRVFENPEECVETEHIIDDLIRQR